MHCTSRTKSFFNIIDGAAWDKNGNTDCRHPKTMSYRTEYGIRVLCLSQKGSRILARFIKTHSQTACVLPSRRYWTTERLSSGSTTPCRSYRHYIEKMNSMDRGQAMIIIKDIWFNDIREFLKWRVFFSSAFRIWNRCRNQSCMLRFACHRDQVWCLNSAFSLQR